MVLGNAYFILIHFRFNLPIIFIIINNNGIYAGLDEKTFKEIQKDNHPCLT